MQIEEFIQSHISTTQKCLDQGDINSALDNLYLISKVAPQTISLSLDLIRVLREQGKVCEAVSQLSRLLDIDTNQLGTDLRKSLIDLLLELQQYDLAQKIIVRAIELNPNDVSNHLERAEYLKKMGNFGLAIRSYQRAIKCAPELAQSSNKQHFRASIPYQILAVQTAWDELIEELDKTPLPVTNTETAYEQEYLAALKAVKRGELPLALDSFSKVLKIDAQLYQVYFGQACIYLTLLKLAQRSDLLSSAIDSFRETLNLKPDYTPALFKLAECCRRLKKSEQVGLSDPMNLYKQCLELDPDFHEVQHEIGTVFALEGLHEQAFEHFTKYYQGLEKRATSHPLKSLGFRFMDEHAATAVGHLAQTPDNLLKSQALEIIPAGKTVLTAPPQMTSNSTLLTLWDQHLIVLRDTKLIRQLRPLRRGLGRPSWLGLRPDNSAAYTSFSLSYVQEEWEKRGKNPLLTVPQELFKRGWETLEKLGVPRGAWIVTLQVRQAGYKPEIKGSPFDRFRNADPKTYLPAIQHVIDHGGWVIRLGEPTMELLPECKGLIQYSHSDFKSDWMDIFLCGSARFFLGGSGGVTGIPQAFRVPLVASNYPPGCTVLFNSCDLSCPQLLFSRKLNRLLRFDEILSPPYAYTEDLDVFNREEIDCIKTTADEILETTKEMLERLDGTINYSPEDELLQERFRKAGCPTFGKKLARAGRYYLRKHADLL